MSSIIKQALFGIVLLSFYSGNALADVKIIVNTPYYKYTPYGYKHYKPNHYSNKYHHNKHHYNKYKFKKEKF